MNAISLFTGAGGLDIGFENAGFDILSTLEIHPSYCSTVREMKKKGVTIPGKSRTYFQDAKIIEGDIRETSAKDLLCGKKDVDSLIGGPPCQAFSSAGKQLSIFDERGTLVYEYFRLLKEIMPKVFLFENVRGLVTARGKNNEPGEILNDLLDRFAGLGYNCRVDLLNSADFGSPQRRVRCFIIGSRIAAAPEFPPPTHSEKPQESLFVADRRLPWTTLGDFLETHADQNEEHWTLPSEKLAEALKDIPEGSGLKSQGAVEVTRPGGHWGYRQGTFIADQTKPARTVTGSSSQDWIRTKSGVLRRLTLREVARLQGFPDEWDFSGSLADQFQQVGNAVPTIFGEILGKTIHDYLHKGYKACEASNATVLPDRILNAIKYTKYDNMKNGAFRVRKNMPLAQSD